MNTPNPLSPPPVNVDKETNNCTVTLDSSMAAVVFNTEGHYTYIPKASDPSAPVSYPVYAVLLVAALFSDDNVDILEALEQRLSTEYEVDNDPPMTNLTVH